MIAPTRPMVGTAAVLRAFGALLAMLLMVSLLGVPAAHAQATRASVTAAPDVLRVLPPPDEEPPYNYSGFSSQSVPTTMTAGGVYSVTVRMVNSGTTTWSSSTGHALGASNPADNLTWGSGRIALAGNVAPGQTATFTFQVTAPAAAGSYNFQWMMVQGGVESFGAPTDNVLVTVLAAPSDDAQIVAASAPVAMTQGQSYPVSVTVLNKGNTTWPAGSAYALGSQNPPQCHLGQRPDCPR